MTFSQYVGAATVAYVLATVAQVIGALSRGRVAHGIARIVGAGAFTLHTAALASRVMASGRLPLSNTYETLLLLSWCLAVLTLWLQSRPRLRSLAAMTFTLIVLALAAASLPQISSEIEPLLPALKSNWLLVHVLTCFVSYAAFGAAFAAAALHLLSRPLARTPQRRARLDKLADLSDRAVVFGYPLLTLGIVTGALWADVCWGRYWSWDPKETSALVTWAIYSAHVHLRYARLARRWGPWIAIAGFLAIIFTYLGVNYLLPSIHAYT